MRFLAFPAALASDGRGSGIKIQFKKRKKKKKRTMDMEPYRPSERSRGKDYLRPETSPFIVPLKG